MQSIRRGLEDDEEDGEAFGEEQIVGNGNVIPD